MDASDSGADSSSMDSSLEDPAAFSPRSNKHRTGMNITSASFERLHRQASTDYAPGTRLTLDLKVLNIENKKIEVRAISTKSSMCATGNVGDFDMKKLSEMKDGQFFNPQLMKAVACVTMGIFYGLQQNHGDIATIAHFKDSVMRDMHRFGSPSVSGYALTGRIDGVPGMYVLKSPRDPEASTDLTHELFVGLNGINSLRKVVLNFAMIYGGFRCPAPVVDSEGNVVDFCGVTGKGISTKRNKLTVERGGEYRVPKQQDQQVPMVVYESITPSDSFERYIQSCTVQQFHEFFLQMLYSTQMAAELIGYTHYDAHNQNWLARKVEIPKFSKGFALQYQDYRTDTTKYVNVKSKVIATAIDFGMSMIKYEDRYIGVASTNLAKYGVSMTPWPLHDAYKLLMFSAETLRKSIKTLAAKSSKHPRLAEMQAVLDEMQNIFTFFNQEEDIVDAAKNQLKYYYGLPKTQDNEGLNIYNLLDHIERHCEVKGVLTAEPMLPILSCGDSCLTYTGAINTTLTTPKSFFEFYDTAYHLNKADTKQYEALVRTFDYTANKAEFLAKVERDWNLLESKLAEARPISLPEQTNVNTLKDKKTMDRLEAYYQSVFGMVSLYEDIILWLKVGGSVAELYRDEELLEQMDKYYRQLLSRRDDIGQVVEANYHNYKIIKSVVINGLWTSDKLNDHYYPWYITVSGEIYWLKERWSENTFGKDFKSAELPPVAIEQSRSSRARDTLSNSILPTNRSVRLQRDSDGNPRSIVMRRRG